MNSFIKNLSVLFLATLLLAGCGGGGSSSSAPPAGGGGGGVAGALDAGGTGVSTGEVADNAGNPVTANFTSALDINDLNQVIGFAEVTAGAPFTAALWTVDAAGDAAIAPAALNPIDGNTFSAAFAIDENGNAVGQSAKGTQLVAVIWPAGATPVQLPALTAAGNSKALAISADGTLIVGEAQDASSRTRGVLWIADTPGVFTAAPTVLPFAAFASGSDLSPFSSASGVARVGDTEILVVGEAEAGNGDLHAALWRSVNGGTTFAASSLGIDHIAFAVNGARQVVGESDAGLSPVSWTISDLGVASAPASLATAGSAVAINENGRIAGWSGAASLATVWDGATPVTLSENSGQAYGLNNDAQPLVVGREGAQGFVKRVN
ncbi:hypothetical protein [Desulfuromonas sp. TF]|uniref:hypothetical protein n=1 Tax=Desulfuromonas sp. TF TaxID=1232410 RepID=UPI0003F665D4|nr:hypothetical protein [Desulfuromonas sp. TF]